MDGDLGAIVVEDGAGAVDDFLVALDLRYDLPLYLQRRQGDFDLSERVAVKLWLPSARGKVFRLLPILLGSQFLLTGCLPCAS